MLVANGDRFGVPRPRFFWPLGGDFFEIVERMGVDCVIVEDCVTVRLCDCASVERRGDDETTGRWDDGLLRLGGARWV